MTDIAHEMLPEGESTANWFCQTNKFWGTVDQILRCARCGIYERKGHHEPRYYRDTGKPSLHTICGDCNESLPS